MKLSEKLQFLLSQTGRTRGELATAFGCQRQRIDDLFSGRVARIRPHEAEQVALQWRINPDWLLKDRGEMFLPVEEHAALVQRQSEQEGQEITRDVPGLTENERRQIQQLFLGLKTRDAGVVRAALGGVGREMVQVPRHEVATTGAALCEDGSGDHLAFRRDWITRVLGLDPARLALIDMVGDAMAPTIAQGDLLLLDTRPGRCLRDGLYVIAVNGLMLVRRLRMRLSGHIDVGCDNPVYDNERLASDELDRLMVIGRVAWHGRTV